MFITFAPVPELCPDGTPKDPSIGCINAPSSLIEATRDPAHALFSASNALLILVIGIATLALMWGAIQYITATGEEEKQSRAKRTMTWSILGLIVALFAKLITSMITSFAT